MSFIWVKKGYKIGGVGFYLSNTLINKGDLFLLPIGINIVFFVGRKRIRCHEITDAMEI